MIYLLTLVMLSSSVFANEKKTLIYNLRSFVKQSKPNRIPGTPGHRKVQEYLRTYFSTFDTYFEVQGFTPDYNEGKLFYTNDFKNKIESKYKKASSEYKKWDSFTRHMVNNIDGLKGKKFENYVWIKKVETSSDWLIIMAHYDSISHNKKNLTVQYKEQGPGADYNGTGVAIAMTLAERFKNQNFKKNLMILLPDLHAFAFLGAKYFVDNIEKYIPNGSQVYLLNLEMLGHDTSAFDKTKKNFNFKAYTRSGTKDDKAINLVQKFNGICKGNLYFDLQKNNFDNSDHVRFWKTSISSITFSQNWEDDFNSHAYQTSSDIVETINQDSYYEAYKFIKCLSYQFLTN
jgi:Zn-dependent M28 family amino/carboxypeptidase